MAWLALGLVLLQSPLPSFSLHKDLEGLKLVHLGMGRIQDTLFILFVRYKNQKVHIYLEYHSVCPLVGIGTHPPPLGT
jgi:hypothetical protein